MIPVYAEKGIPFATKDRAVSLHGKRDLPANRQVDQDSFSSSSADTLNNAVVGISGAHRVLIQVFNRFHSGLRTFSDSGAMIIPEFQRSRTGVTIRGSVCGLWSSPRNMHRRSPENGWDAREVTIVTANG